jgi:ubiquitin-conjugating enzyme E2 D
MVVPDDYPFKPPKIKFVTKIYHPAVQEDGTFCIPILTDEKWSPQIKLNQVFMAVRTCLSEPDGQLNPEVAQVMKENPSQFEATAREWTQKYAK